MREKLTDRFAATVPPTPGKVDRYFDTDRRRSPRGLLLRVSSGAKVWALRYRVRDTKREREITIGDVKSWPLAEARKEGHRLRREIDARGDPLADREEARSGPTVDELARRFVDEALSSRSTGTADNYRAMLRDWILPSFGKRKVSTIDRDDIEALHRKITALGKLRQANAVKSLCSVLFAQAITWRLRGTNPCSGVRGNVEHNRERYLSPEEIARLVDVLDRWHPRRPDSVDAIRLLLLTGSRRGEVCGMRWAQIENLDGAATWVLPSTSTKEGKRTGRIKRLPLSPEAIAVLRRRHAEREAAGKIVRLCADDHVFVGAGSKTHTNSLEKDWYQIRSTVGIEDVRLHDLRHSFASLLVSEGLSLPIIGAMLGHSKPQTTQRYSHLADAPLREAAGIVGKIVGRRTP